MRNVMAGQGGRDVDRDDWADTSEEDEGGVLPMGPPEEVGPRDDDDPTPTDDRSQEADEEATP